MNATWDWSAPIQAPGLYIEGVNDRGTAFLAYSNSEVVYGDSRADGTYFEQEGLVNRELPGEKVVHFRLVRKGRMTEFYLNDFLMHCYCLPDLGSGRINSVGIANFKNIESWYCD